MMFSGLKKQKIILERQNTKCFARTLKEESCTRLYYSMQNILSEFKIPLYELHLLLKFF